MAGGGFIGEDSRGVNGGFSSKITMSVVITSVVAASSGLLYGYDVGISGGVTTMEAFLKKFFPSVWEKESEVETNLYCIYDSQILTSFTSSLYLAGLLSLLAAGRLTAAFGRKAVMVLGGCTFVIGATINACSENIAMLIVGRILLGFAVGFTNQAAPVYLAEMAPANWRGAFNTGFQFFISLGVVVANCINYVTAERTWGWRLSLGLAAVPGVIMTAGALLISDTPASLVHRGKLTHAKRLLLKVRGIETDVEPELEMLIRSRDAARSVGDEPFFAIFKRQYRPHLVLSIAFPFFQQLTGINVFAFYAPVLFKSVGFGSDSALIAAIILGLVNLASNVVSSAVVDRRGRRFLFIYGGILMFACQVGVAAVLGATMGTSGTKHISKGYDILILVLLCIYISGFGWSWGPLIWLIPPEILPTKIRPIGQSISVSVNFAITFVLAQTFLTMLCHFKYGTFIFFAGWVVGMTLFVALFLPETKGIPLDNMVSVWERHWFWRRYVGDITKDSSNIYNLEEN